MLKSSLLTLLGVFMTAISTVTTAKPVYYNDTETIPYEVIATLDEGVEIREYPEALAVATPMNGSNNAFRLLFNYISGENIVKTKVSMTTPVEMGPAKIAMTTPVLETGDQAMMFFLPSQFTADNAPKPTHPKVTLVSVPVRTIAAKTYSGYRSDRKLNRHTDTLMRVLKSSKYQVTGQPNSLGYDSPFTLPFKRRNEVIVTVEAKT